MDRKLRKILTDCIGDIETGARDVEGCLQRHPDWAAELRPHLELWSNLNAAPKAQPNFGSQQRGKQQMLATLSETEKKRAKRMIPLLTPAVAKATVALAAAALLVGGAAGATAAFGGPDITDGVLNTLGIQTAHDTLETVDDSTPEAADDGLDTAQEAADNGLTTAGEHAADGAGAPEDAPQASDSVPENAQVPDSVPAGPTP